MRGNIEGLVWIGVCLGAALYAHRSYRGAAVAFAIASCIKPYPVLWLVLMARHRRYRELAIGIITTAGVTLASLLVIDRNPLRAYRYTTGKSTFFQDYVVAFRPFDEMKGDHSLIHEDHRPRRAPSRIQLPIHRIHGAVEQSSRLDALQGLPAAGRAHRPARALEGLEQARLEPGLRSLLRHHGPSLCHRGLHLDPASGPMGFFIIFLLEDVAQGKTPMSMGKILWFLLPCAWIVATEPLLTLHGVFKCLALLVLLAASISIPLPSTLFAETSA
jgi:hypothetical protein